MTKRDTVIGDIEAVRDWLELALRATNIGLWQWDVVADRLDLDQRTLDLFELGQDAAGSVNDLWSRAVHPDDLQRTTHEVELALKGEQRFDTEYRIVVPGGAVRYLRSTGDVIRDDAGKPLRMIGANWDVTKEREDQRMLFSTLRKLQSSNAELERFAYAVAHDLQAPLRHIKAFTEIIAEKLEDPESYEDEGEIDRIVRSSERMQALIRDLLAYSRVGESRLKAERFSPAAAVQDAIDLFAPEIREQGAVVTIGDMPAEVDADRGQLTLVFQNLIGNGLKYCSPGKQAEVTIEGSEDPATWHFVVSDNGIGVAPGQAERIFKVFQRLHTEQEYSGTGIGLAICEKIVRAHGGRIWVEAATGGGSAFRFYVPKESG